MAATLTGMPLELLVHIIATYLSTKDLGSLRLTNKHLEKALFDKFAKEFFTKKQFMLTTPSLQTLVDISKHAALSKCLQHVIIGLDQYTYGPIHDEHNEAYRNGKADQLALVGSGRSRDMLAEAFRNLPSLTTLGIRDYNALGRVRDNSRWHSYGAATVFQETGLHLSCPSSTALASQVIPMLLQALAEADRSVPSIEIIMRSPDAGMSDLAFFLPQTDSGLKPVLEGLQSLLLTLHLDELHDFNTEPYFVESFLLRTSSLKHLRLNFHDRIKSASSGLLHRLSTHTNLLPDLRRLDLGMLTANPDELLDFFSKFSPTLSHIGLWKVTLHDNDSKHWTDSEGRFNPWPPFLRDISRMPLPCLKSMTLGCIAQIDLVDYIRVNFANGKHTQDRSGDMKTWLPQLIDDMRVDWPEPPASSWEDEDHSEEDDDDDNDEDMEDADA